MPTRKRSGVVTNSEGFEIKKPVAWRNQLNFVLFGILQLVAVAIIVRQLKTMGIVPEWVDTDFSGVRTFLAAYDPAATLCGTQCNDQTCCAVQ